MSTIFYKIKQMLSGGEQVTCSCAVLPVAGPHKVKFQLSDGRWLDAGELYADDYISYGRAHKLTIQMSDGATYTSDFYGHFGLNKPELSELKWALDSRTGTHYGSVKVKNNNYFPVKWVVWYKTSGSETIRFFNGSTLQPGETDIIAFDEVYSGGICLRVHFTYASQRIEENEVFQTITLGSYRGDQLFYGVGDGVEEEESTTTTTTTTPEELSIEPVPIESDGKFTLWRKQDDE